MILETLHSSKCYITKWFLQRSDFLSNFSVTSILYWPFKRQSHKMVKHTQTISRQIADEFFEWVWPFCRIGAERINSEQVSWYGRKHGHQQDNMVTIFMYLFNAAHAFTALWMVTTLLMRTYTTITTKIYKTA